MFLMKMRSFLMTMILLSLMSQSLRIPLACISNNVLSNGIIADKTVKEMIIGTIDPIVLLITVSLEVLKLSHHLNNRELKEQEHLKSKTDLLDKEDRRIEMAETVHLSSHENSPRL